MASFIAKLFGNKKDRDVKDLQPYAKKINAEYAKLSSLSDDELRAKTDTFRERIQSHVKEISDQIDQKKKEAESTTDIMAKDGIYTEVEKLTKERNEKFEEVLEELIPEAFAVVKETARRLTENGKLEVKASDLDRELAEKKDFVEIVGDKSVWKNEWDAAGTAIKWNMIHYDVQLMGGVALHQGKIAEMATGEGKTLVSTLPSYLNALTGMGVHLVTVNDYLARRDADWNAPLFWFHGISVDCIDLHEPNTDDRRKAYRADITYGTNNEFGFDYLRDNMTSHPDFLVQRPHHYAMIDEIDSVLIDEARTPLIISGPVPQGDKHEYHQLKPRIEKLVSEQRKLVNKFLATAKKTLPSDKKEDISDGGGLALFRAFRGPAQEQGPHQIPL